MEALNKIIRVAPSWISEESKLIKSKKDLINVIEAKYPIGLLPKNLISTNQIQLILNILPTIQCKKYENTDETENVKVWGQPFVDSDSTNNHLSVKKNILFETILNKPFGQLIKYYESFGLRVEALKDSITGIEYSSKVVRKISVPINCKKEDGNSCNVYHFDDILRDSLIKSDFRLPKGLEINNYHQFSVCFPLENGFYQPDNLEVCEFRYFPKTKEELLNWRVKESLIENVSKCIHKPVVGEPYMFNTQNVHNVAGGHPLSNRINFSVFFVYVPSLNKLFYYN